MIPNKQRKEHTVDAPLLAFDIEKYIKTLKTEKQWITGNRNAITLLKTSELCVLLISLRNNARMDEHQVDGPFTLFVISGMIRLVVNNLQINLNPHELIALGGEIPHEIEALEDSAILLTFAYPAN